MRISHAFPVSFLCAAVLSAQPSPAPTPAPTPAVTALRAARIFDGTGDRALENGVVVIEGSKIKAVGSGVPVPAGATVIDLGDATLLPGFIDSHTHLTSQGSDNYLQGFFDGLRRTVAEDAYLAEIYARRTLDAGFTTVRNVGASDDVDVGLRNAIAKAWVAGPRMLVSRYPLGSIGGHCDRTGFPEGTFGPGESGPEKGKLVGADQARQAVRLQVKYGADVIKMCVSGGVLSLGDDVSAPQMTDEEIAAAVDEAHRLGRRTAAHAHGDLAARAAVKAGIDSIEHGSFMTDETLALMKAKGTYLVPTLLAGDWVTRPGADYPPAIAAKAAAAIAVRSDMFRRALKTGVRVAFGTDAGVFPHGTNGREFGLMVGLGMPPAAALRTTATAADLLGLAAKIGTLEAGKEADVVAVPGNPLADIHTTERVFFVMKGGEVKRNDRR